MLAYATSSDLTSPTPPWVDPPPDNVGSLLRWASIVVAEACQYSLYGPAPVEPAADVLRDATCAQVASWVALGVDPAKGGTDMPGPVKSSSILDGKVDRDTTAAAQLAVEATKGLCDLARAILQTAGLLWVPTPLGADPCDPLPTWGLDSPLHSWGGGGGEPAENAYGNGYTTPALCIPPDASSSSTIVTHTGDFTVQPGDEAWALVGAGQTIHVQIAPEPAGQHVRLKNLPESQGPLIATPSAGMLIDGQATFTLQPGDAFEFDSDGTRLSIF